jgi:Tfp pilus assembly protein FimT
LLDVLFACALIAILAAVAVPSVQGTRERDASLLAARFLASKLNFLRVEALRRNRTVAMRFDPDDLGRFAAYADGDGDGVRQQDIESGVDLPLEHEAHVSQYFQAVSFRVPLAVPAPDGNGVINADSDPVRIGNTDLLSFSPLSTSTSGTIYLAGRGGTQVCVRILGSTGRVRVLRFDSTSGVWRPE